MPRSDPEADVAGLGLGSSWPRSCRPAGSVKSRGREARAGLGQRGPSRLREYRVGAQKTVSVLWGIQGEPSAQPLGTGHLQVAGNLGEDQMRGWSEQEARGSGTGVGEVSRGVLISCAVSPQRPLGLEGVTYRRTQDFPLSLKYTGASGSQ